MRLRPVKGNGILKAIRRKGRASDGAKCDGTGDFESEQSDSGEESENCRAEGGDRAVRVFPERKEEGSFGAACKRAGRIDVGGAQVPGSDASKAKRELSIESGGDEL